MLPRLILLTLLAAGGLQAATTLNHDNPNVIGIRRFVDRLRLGASGDGAAVGDARDCSGSGCAGRSMDSDGGDGGVGELKLEAEKGSVVEEVKDEEDEEDEEVEDDGSAVEEGRGRKKKKKGYGKMLIVLAGVTKAAMLYIMIHAVAALAGKALIVAKVALAIATALALKKSIDHKTSYEIVKHPQYSHVQTHSSSVDYDHSGGGYEGGSRRRRRRALRR